MQIIVASAKLVEVCPLGKLFASHSSCGVVHARLLGRSRGMSFFISCATGNPEITIA